MYDESNSRQPPFKKLIFKRLLKLATGGMFVYNGQLYQQIDGVTMGSPLGPTLANFFLAHIEQEIMKDDNLVKPNSYLRYVDDIFAVFSNGVDYVPFFNKLNSQHKNLKFTVEVGGNHLAFLDTQILIENSDFETWIYRKTTNTNVILNFSAICPIQWKKGLVKCFLYRAWTICSNYKRLHEEIERLKSIFIDNGYPVNFFENIVKQFLESKVLPKKTNLVLIDDKNDEKRFVLKIPYVGKPSLEFKRRITNLVKEAFGIDLYCVFESFKVKNYFSLKCKASPYLAANVVYKFSCRSDPNVFYIGETKRHLGIRASEHLDTESNAKTAVGKHISMCEGCRTELGKGDITHKDFEILKQGRSKFDIEICEAFMVKELNPTLNKQLFKSGCNFTCKIFV